MPRKRAASRVSTSALLRLLSSDDAEEICGAALVLGALRPGDARVIPALGRALKTAAVPVKPYLLDALGAFDSVAAARHIAPFLLAQGALREQAVRLMSRHGDEAVAILRRQAKEASEAALGALIQVAMDIATPACFDFVLELLPPASFERAKYLYSAVGRRVEGFGTSQRRELARRLVAFLASDSGNPTAEIAAVKMLGVLGQTVAITPLLSRVEEGHRTALRQAAVDALANLTIPASRRRAVAKRLIPHVERGDPPRLAATAVRVLRRIEAEELGCAELMTLSRSEHPELARAAIRELRDFPRREVVENLLGLLLVDNPALQNAAAGSLATLDAATDHLVQAHEDPRYAGRRAMIREILESRRRPVEPARFRRLANELLGSGVEPEILRARLLVLATLDRDALNRTVEARARLALKQEDPERVLQLLEPLVRGRLASPQGRYLLALGHLWRAGPEAKPGDADHDRSMQLLGPLARVEDWNLRRALLRETRLPDGCLKGVAEFMAGRPEPERSLAAALKTRLG